MSASREKKTRQERGADYLSPKQQKALEEQKANRRTTIIFTVCAIAFVLAVAVMALSQSGILHRGAAAVRVGDKTYSAAEVSYYYYNARFSLQNGGIVNSQTSLRKQPYGDDGTWYDYAAETAAESLVRTTTIAQAAKDAGFSVSAESEEAISSTVDSVKSAAKSNSVSYAQYLKALFGSLMTPEVFEDCLRTEQLASNYTASVSDVSNFTADELAAKRDADPESYDAIAVRHILVEDEAAANDILAQYQAGDQTEDSFAELAKEHSTDPGSKDNGGLYENVYRGQMVAEFNDWCFDNSRMPGDTGIVKTDYGYHIMYFVSRGIKSDWEEDVAASLASEKLAALYADITPELLAGMKYIDP